VPCRSDLPALVFSHESHYVPSYPWKTIIGLILRFMHLFHYNHLLYHLYIYFRTNPRTRQLCLKFSISSRPTKPMSITLSLAPHSVGRKLDPRQSLLIQNPRSPHADVYGSSHCTHRDPHHRGHRRPTCCPYSLLTRYPDTSFRSSSMA